MTLVHTGRRCRRFSGHSLSAKTTGVLKPTHCRSFGFKPFSANAANCCSANHSSRFADSANAFSKSNSDSAISVRVPSPTFSHNIVPFGVPEPVPIEGRGAFAESSSVPDPACGEGHPQFDERGRCVSSHSRLPAGYTIPVLPGPSPFQEFAHCVPRAIVQRPVAQIAGRVGFSESPHIFEVSRSVLMPDNQPV